LEAVPLSIGQDFSDLLGFASSVVTLNIGITDITAEQISQKTQILCITTNVELICSNQNYRNKLKKTRIGIPWYM